MKSLRGFLAGFAIFLLYRVLSLSWRVQWNSLPEELCSKLSSPSSDTVLLAHWHRDEWSLIGPFSNKGLTTLVSLSEDGNIMAWLLKFLGYKIFRGSSSRGGATGLVGLIRLLKKNPKFTQWISLAVDGPKGPAFLPKPGIFSLSQKLNLPIFAMAASADSSWVFSKSWSQAFIPRPFAKVGVAILGPLVFGDSPNQIKLTPESEKLLIDLIHSAKQKSIEMLKN